MKNLVLYCRPFLAACAVVMLVPLPASAGYPYWVERVLSSQYYYVESLENFRFIYGDRDYVFTSVPDCLVGQGYVVTANEDKFSGGDDFMAIRSDIPVSVYVGYDNRYGTKPDWLVKQFRQVGASIQIGGPSGDRAQVTFDLHRADFEPGTFFLGGNLAAGEKSNFAMYTVLISPLAEHRCDF